MNTGIGDIADLSWMLEAVIAGWGGEGAESEQRRAPVADEGLKGLSKFSGFEVAGGHAMGE